MIRAAISAAIPFTWWFCIKWHFSCLLIWKLCSNIIWNGFVTPRSNKSAKMTYQSSKGMPKSPSGSQKVIFFCADKHYIENHQKLVSDDGNHIQIKPRHYNSGKLTYQLMAALLAAHVIQNMRLWCQKHDKFAVYHFFGSYRCRHSCRHYFHATFW